LEASVLSQPVKISAIGVRAPFLRLQSDERLISLIRTGDEVAFEALVQRYRSRLFAFCRHMLRSREDAEDVLQEVFAASYRAILADAREINARPWLYRIARNMCLKHIARRRPTADGGVEDLDLAASATTLDAVRMREDLRQVVDDVQELPETQRTALLLREIDGLAYDQIADAMETTVPGVKSLLVRARMSLAEAAQGRLLPCDVVQLELQRAAEGLGGVSGPARRHAKACEACGAVRAAVPARRRAAAALLLPVLGLRDLVAKLGLGAAAGGGAGGAGLVGGGTAAGCAGAAGGACGGTVTAALGALGSKAAVAVATATLAAAGAADIDHARHSRHHAPTAAPAAAQVPVALQGERAHPYGGAVHVTRARAPAPGAAKGSQQPTHGGPTAGDKLPATPADGSEIPPDGTSPTLASTPIGYDESPTDPASQPIDAPEPVQTQGFQGPAPQHSSPSARAVNPSGSQSGTAGDMSAAPAP
jgi:RNA polymerase sigma factor (sigma-70 family)